MWNMPFISIYTCSTEGLFNGEAGISSPDNSLQEFRIPLLVAVAPKPPFLLKLFAWYVSY